MDSSQLKRFEACVLPHLDAAYTLARYMTRSDPDAQDVVQEACLRALKYFEGFRGADDGDGRAWMLTIVRNTAFTWRRRQRGAALTLEFDETEHSDAIADQHPGVALDRTVMQESMSQAIEALVPEFREAIVLREVQGLSYKEISQATGVPVGTVMSRLSRARKRLQQLLSSSQEG